MASFEWARTSAQSRNASQESRLVDSRVLRNECDQVQNDGSAIEVHITKSMSTRRNAARGGLES